MDRWMDGDHKNPLNKKSVLKLKVEIYFTLQNILKDVNLRARHAKKITT